MIVKIFKPGKFFSGVGYNDKKVKKDTGELMLVKNFGALQGFTEFKESDYVDYLRAYSSVNKYIKKPQFHAVITPKGRELDKYQLTELAEKWLEGMGYGGNPYILTFHKDTAHNHIHLVTTRVGPDGKKIDDSYEHTRGYQVMNRLIGEDEKLSAMRDIKQVLAYNFSTRAQLMMLLEERGYQLVAANGHYRVCKYGKVQETVLFKTVDARIAAFQKDTARIRQLRAFIEKYRQTHDPQLMPIKAKLPGGREGRITGYTSELAGLLHEDFGIQLLFHSKDNKPPYGYTLFDHSKKTVYKGSEVISLAELIAPGSKLSASEKPPQEPVDNYWSGEMESRPAEWNPNQNTESNGEPQVEEAYTSPIDVPPLRLDIADDIDDEQINGRNRRRKRKARTNTR